MRVCRRYVGAAGLAGVLLAGAAAPAVEPARVARLGSDRFRQADSVEAIGYSPDGKTLVTAGNNTLHFWDAADGRRLRSVAVDNATFFALRFTPDGKTLYAAAHSGGHTHVCRIDPAAGKVLDNKPLLTKKAGGLFSPDG